MASENKTIAGIIAEKRRLADKIESNYSEVPMRRLDEEGIVEELRYDADRIEAAYKREMGNAAKMRETLRQIHAIATSRGAWDVATLADTALKSPPRQCDVGTEREQHVRFTNYCNAHGDCVDCPIKAEWHTALSCGILWAQMPYEAKEEGAE